MVQRLFSRVVSFDGGTGESGGAAMRANESDEGRILLVPQFLLQSVQGGSADFERTG